jgi:hypothetical protein
MPENDDLTVSKKQDIISKIVDIEWKMFQDVPNIGGKASCQEDYRTFKINRFSQAISWSLVALESYLLDLMNAEKSKRNLLTEKYGRMMESTSPQEYSQIAKLLPPLNAEVIPLIEEIIGAVLSWEEKLKNKYPFIVKRGRPIHTSEDNSGITSLETYLRGELATYSQKTLKLYWENISRQKAGNINGSEVTLEYMMKQYGFKSLEEANERLKSRK